MAVTDRCSDQHLVPSSSLCGVFVGSSDLAEAGEIRQNGWREGLVKVRLAEQRGKSLKGESQAWQRNEINPQGGLRSKPARV